MSSHRCCSTANSSPQTNFPNDRDPTIPFPLRGKWNRNLLFLEQNFPNRKDASVSFLDLGKRRKTLTARNILTNRKKNISIWLKFHPIFLSIFRPERKTREKLSYDSIFELLYSTYNTRLMNNLHACELFMGRKLTINQGLIVYPIRKRTRFAPLSWRGRVCTPRQK